jgi:hypothetical protein
MKDSRRPAFAAGRSVFPRAMPRRKAVIVPPKA